MEKLNKAEIQTLAEVWYRKLDVHAPLIEILPLLDDKNLVMKFPEATLKGLADFEAWYHGVIRIFFDEVHNVKKVSAKIDGDTAEVKVVVEWHASMWKAPAANSLRIKLDAYQTWTVTRSAATGKAVVSRYTVDGFKYHKGSAKL